MEVNEINITTTGLSIFPYKKYQSKALERMTSMRDMATRRHIETTGFNLGDRFVTHHLPKFLLVNEFPKYDIKRIDASRYTIISSDACFNINDDFQLTDIQYSVVKELLSSNTETRWFIHLPQGFGKTIISIYIMSKFRINTMIMCYSTEILYQWREKISKYTDLDMKRCLTIDSSILINNILDDEFDVSHINIFLATPGIFPKYGKKYGYDRISLLFKKLGIGLKIYDEAHRNLGNMVKIDALTSIKYTIYLSGDFAQASKIKTKLFLQMFDGVKVIRPDAKVLFDMRYTNAVIVEYNSNPSEIEKMSMIRKRGVSIWDYMDYQMKKGLLMKAVDWILDHITRLKEPNRRTLILTSKIDHCEIFYEHIKEKYDTYNVGIIHGNIPYEDHQLAKAEAQILIATYNSFSTGMDTENIKYVISTSLSNRVEDSQASGRARPLSDGEDCIFWMLVDVGFEKSVEKETERLLYLQAQKIKNVKRLTYED